MIAGSSLCLMITSRKCMFYTNAAALISNDYYARYMRCDGKRKKSHYTDEFSLLLYTYLLPVSLSFFPPRHSFNLSKFNYTLV